MALEYHQHDWIKMDDPISEVKSVAIMQPYFFPYIGYWQLIHAVDYFVLFDDAQYIRHGWINRNRILKPNGGWQYILVPIRKHHQKESIKNVQINPDIKWKDLIVRQLAHYKTRSEHFKEINNLVIDSLYSNSESSIVNINFSIIKNICLYLDIQKQIIISSKQNFDFTNVDDAGDWALRIAEQMNATVYVNPVAGAELFNEEKFSTSRIRLSFLTSHEIVYSQQAQFEPSLSIIDVLMFNGKEGTKNLLKQYSIESVAK